VLFTDLVGSTAWRMRVGDAVADARMAELERASREVVESAGGSVVKGVGDGVMATFTSAVVAVDVAAALQGVAGRLGVCGSRACLRVGVSTGELVREGDDWLGSAAIEASRLCAEAKGGAVLVADVTARLSRGRTEHTMCSVGEPDQTARRSTRQPSRATSRAEAWSRPTRAAHPNTAGGGVLEQRSIVSGSRVINAGSVARGRRCKRCLSVSISSLRSLGLLGCTGRG
jgi:class 3 adenylate cyclase